MERLKEFELRALLRFVGECYEATGGDDFVSRVLDGLGNLIPGEVISYSEMDPENSVSRDCTNPPELCVPEITQRFDRHMHEHPVLEHNRRTGDSRAWRISDFRSQQQFRKCALFNEFYRYIGIADGLCFVLPSSPSIFVGIAIHRKRWGFPERMRLLARSLQPHLARAWTNALNLDAVQQQMRLCMESCTNALTGIILLSSDGEPLFVNSRAREYLAAYFGHAEVRDGLPVQMSDWIRQQCGHESNFIGKAETSCRMKPGFPVLHCRLVSSLQSRMLVLEPVSAYDRPASFGLTPSEAKILHWVAAGKTNTDIAAIVHRSPATVKKHLEHIYDKLGVETRTAAAALFLRSR